MVGLRKVLGSHGDDVLRHLSYCGLCVQVSGVALDPRKGVVRIEVEGEGVRISVGTCG